MACLFIFSREQSTLQLQQKPRTPPKNISWPVVVASLVRVFARLKVLLLTIRPEILTLRTLLLLLRRSRVRRCGFDGCHRSPAVLIARGVPVMWFSACRVDVTAGARDNKRIGCGESSRNMGHVGVISRGCRHTVVRRLSSGCDSGYPQ